MISTLTSDNNDLVSLFAGDDINHAPQFENTLTPCGNSPSSPTGTELSSDDSMLTTDDLVVLSDLFGLSSTKSSASTEPKEQATSTRPRSRKRPRYTLSAREGVKPPKSQQQRQKLEIDYLKNQIVEMEATIERIQARKLERERRELEKSQELATKKEPSEWYAENQVARAQQLEQQNEKLRSQVATHVEELQKLEMIARNRFLASAFPAQQLPATDNSYY